jgi:hypothetical protein
MKCKACGESGFSGDECPACGSQDVMDDGTTTTQTVEQTAGTDNPGLAMPEMPSMDMPTMAGPVIGTLVLPDTRRVELREGEEFTIAHTDSDDDVTFKADDETVSRTPVKIFAKDGKLFVTGGGGNGFSTITTVRHKPDQTVELPRATNVAVAVGKDTRFAIK